MAILTRHAAGESSQGPKVTFLRSVRDAAELTQWEMADRMTERDFPMDGTAVSRFERRTYEQLAGEGLRIQAWLQIAGIRPTNVEYQEFLAATGNPLHVPEEHQVTMVEVAVLMQSIGSDAARVKAALEEFAQQRRRKRNK